MAEASLAQRVLDAAAHLRQRAPQTPRVALILGTGLGDLARQIEASNVVRYEDVPHMARSTVRGHAGQFVLGTLAGVPVAAMQGRLHFYEGHSLWDVTFPVRVLRRLGAEVLLVSNAAGGLNRAFVAGDLMLISDHLSLMAMAGYSPLIGVDEPELGPRFPNMVDAYDPELRALARQVAADEGLTLREGVYVQLAGPSFETLADIRFLRQAGADAVGMSTVPEVIVARQEGLRVLGISAITNVWHEPTDLSHAEVLAAADELMPRFVRLVSSVVEQLGPTP